MLVMVSFKAQDHVRNPLWDLKYVLENLVCTFLKGVKELHGPDWPPNESGAQTPVKNTSNTRLPVKNTFIYIGH